MKSVVFASSVVALAAASLWGARDARACGGCFSPPAPRQVTVVTGHRMAVSISPTQSVLWDQIQYSGSPQDFAWVLPVRAGAKVQLSHDELFAALDAMTSPVITGPKPPTCGSAAGAFACSSSSAAGNSSGFSAGAGGGGNGVQVLSQGVVGPYDTVTVRSTNPSALYDWLVANSYDIPASTRPIIDAYVAAGFDFLALRLKPGEGVQAMQPVRVVTPGAGLTLPLRMVAAGVGAQVGITLYVISDGRYSAQNFPNGTVDTSKLVWIASQSESNYETLAEQVMQGGGGRTWLTEFAALTAITDTAGTVAATGGYTCGVPAGSGAGSGGLSYNGGGSLPGLYYAQCLCLGGSGLCPQVLEAGADASDEASADDAGSVDANDEGAEDSGGDSGTDSGGLTAPDGGCNTSSCAGYDDLQVATVGLDPSSTWVTRMRAILPSSALSSDLVLQASASQASVSSNLFASKYDDPTYDACPGSGGCATTDREPVLGGRALVAAALCFVGAALARRRRRRRL